MIGRPREFDRDVVLQKAIRLFWQNGFEATGIAELSEHLGIGRQSLYGTFGDKRTLFLEALRQYSDDSIGWLTATLDAPGSAVDNINAVLDTWVANSRKKDFCGCLMTNSISELGIRDPELRKLLKRNLGKMSAAFERALDRGKADGAISPDTDTRALAKMLVNTGQGLAVSAKVDSSYGSDVVKAIRDIMN